MPAVFVMWQDQHLVAALRPAGHCVLLPCLLAFLDTLVLAVNAHYTAYRHVFGQHQSGKEDMLKCAAVQGVAY
jgi:hypothetical protein